MGRKKTEERTYPQYQRTIQSICTWSYHLPEAALERGRNYPHQNDTWDCGPNSAGRALQMWPKISTDYSHYSIIKSNCPKTFGMPNTTTGQIKFGIAHLLTFGISTAVAALADATTNWDVGPTPSALASYISDLLTSKGRGIHAGYSCFNSALNAIKSDLAQNDPVVVLLAFGPASMHYVNVVGVSNENNVAILDTHGELYYYTESDFEDLLDCRSYPHISHNYNVIRFEKT